MRLEFEQVIYQEECDLVPPKDNFLPLLEGLGFDVRRPLRPITMHRGPRRVHGARVCLKSRKLCNHVF